MSARIRWMVMGWLAITAVLSAIEWFVGVTPDSRANRRALHEAHDVVLGAEWNTPDEGLLTVMGEPRDWVHPRADVAALQEFMHDTTRQAVEERQQYKMEARRLRADLARTLHALAVTEQELPLDSAAWHRVRAVLADLRGAEQP